VDRSRETGLGDLVRAFRRLAPRDPDEARAIAQLLGVAPPLTTPSRTHSDEPTPPTLPLRPHLERDNGRTTSESGGTSSDSGGDGRAPDVGATTPVFVDPLPDEGPSLEAVPATSLQTWGWTGTAPALETLFEPRAMRNVLAGLAAVWRREGVPDLTALVDDVVRCRPIRRLPRRLQATLRGGVQVLEDRGEGMEPFARDATELIEALRRVAGKSQVEVLGFNGFPAIAGAGPTRKWTTYRPPTDGRAVLVLTDLGISPVPTDPANVPERWIDLATSWRQAGASVAVLVPYPARRWPAGLGAALPLVEWDRGTTVASVRQTMRARGR
jgi:hypothetical protein